MDDSNVCRLWVDMTVRICGFHGGEDLDKWPSRLQRS